MARAMGIDLSRTNSVVAVDEGGQPVVIADSEGALTTPSMAATDTGERLVGLLARRQGVLDPTGTIYSAERLSRRSTEVRQQADSVPYDVVPRPDDAVRLAVHGKQYAPEEFSARVLRAFAEDAGKHFGAVLSGDVHDGATITVDEVGRQLTSTVTDPAENTQGRVA